jgi:hypothetical protein
VVALAGIAVAKRVWFGQRQAQLNDEMTLWKKYEKN